MNAASQKTPVRIVCPHCRRTYVIKVDLRRIYHTKPRAICSRCGGRFEVVQRMYEIEHDHKVEAIPPDAKDERPTPSRQEARQPRKARPRGASVGERVDRPSTKTRKPKKTRPFVREGIDTEPLEGPRTPQGRHPRQDERAEAATPAEASVVDEPPKPEVVAKETVPAVDSTPPPSLPELGGAPPAREEVRTPVETPAAKASLADQAEALEASPAPSPIGDLGLGEDSTEFAAPIPPDLEAPLPWIEKAKTSLDALRFQLPESAAALEWLLTERPSRPQGASPPPIPVDPYLDPEPVDDADVVDEEHVVGEDDLIEEDDILHVDLDEEGNLTEGQQPVEPEVVVDEHDDSIVETRSLGTPKPHADDEDEQTLGGELTNALDHVLDDDADDAETDGDARAPRDGEEILGEQDERDDDAK